MPLDDSYLTDDPTQHRVKAATRTRAQQDADLGNYMSSVFRRQDERQARADESQARVDSFAPPQLQVPPAPPKEESHPLLAFGQPAMWVAIFGSLFTRGKMVNAVNAAASVFQSAHQLDTEAAQQHYNQWRIERENAFKLASYEQKAYDSLIKKAGSDNNAAAAGIRTMAAALKDGVLEHVYQTEGYAGVQKLLTARKKATREAQSGVAVSDKQAKQAISEADMITSGDPEQQAQALDMKAKDLRRYSTKANRSGNDQKATDLEVLASSLRSAAKSGDQAALQARQGDVARAFGVSQFTKGVQSASADSEADVNTIANEQIAKGEASEGRKYTDAEKAQIRQDVRNGVLKGKTQATAQARYESMPGLSREAAKLDANIYLLTGQMPGNRSAKAQTQIQDAAAELAESQGKSAQDYITGRAQWKADTGSLATAQKMADGLNQSETTTLRNMRIAEGLMDKGAGTDAGPVVNRWLQAGKVATGDPDVAAFNTAIGVVASEAARVLSGGGLSTAQTHQGMQEEIQKWLDKFGSTDAIRSQFGVLRQDMASRKQSAFEQLDIIRERMGGSQGGGTGPKAGTIEDGYRFKGGDAHDPNNWEQVK